MLQLREIADKKELALLIVNYPTRASVLRYTPLYRRVTNFGTSQRALPGPLQKLTQNSQGQSQGRSDPEAVFFPI